MVLLILLKLESLIPVGCESHSFNKRDPIIAAASAALDTEASRYGFAL